MRGVALVALLGGCDVIWRLDHVPERDKVPIVGRWASVDAGYAHACALDNTRHLWCWGRNGDGELGRSSSAFELDTVEQVGDVTWTSVSASTLTTCGIRTDGSGWCWGDNFYGQLGPPAGTSTNAPKQLAGTWRELSAGAYHVCGIRDDKTLWCWGRNDTGQLGNGTMETSPNMSTIVGGGSWVHVSAGYGSTCAIRDDDTLWCWGANGFGELGIGSTDPTSRPTQVGSESWRAISAGNSFACGITATKRLRCWGANPLSELGDGTQTNRATPTAVLLSGADRTEWAAVETGFQHGCALDDGGHIYCWGASARGHVGLDGALMSATPVEVVGPAPFISLGVGYANTCGIAEDRSLYCLGANGYGQLGDGGTSKTAPTQVPGEWKTASTGEIHTCALSMTNMMFCAGDNSVGELGTGTRDSSDTFVRTLGSDRTAIAAGYRHSCGISNGVASCWGANAWGEVGSGNLIQTTSPVDVITAGQIAASAHTCSIDFNGALSCWGLNINGQVGNGTTDLQLTPFTFPMSSWAVIGVGIGHTCVIENSSAQVSCWGRNDVGQLGRGTPSADAPSPAQLIPPRTATQLSVGGFHVCVIDSAGAAACWGHNGFGQLGIGDTVHRATATPLPGAWASLAAGNYHTCGIRPTGALLCWGVNDRGQLGDGTRTQRIAPVQVGTATDWRSVHAGYGHTCATKTDNSLWCWGDNDYGQLALPAWSASLVQVP